MSRDNPSPLDRAFAEQGLMRLGGVAKRLGVDVEVVRNYVKAGAIKSGYVDWFGKRCRGVPIEEVDRLVATLATVKAKS